MRILVAAALPPILMSSLALAQDKNAPAHTESCALRNPYREKTILRYAPNSAQIVTIISNGQSVQFAATTKDKNKIIWARIYSTSRGWKGWVHSNYLDCARKAIAPVEALKTMAAPTTPTARAEDQNASTEPAELSCELVGRCTAARPGAQNNDQPCPYGFVVSNGNYKLRLREFGDSAVVTEPGKAEVKFAMICDDKKCYGINSDVTADLLRPSQFMLDMKNFIFKYGYSFKSGDSTQAVLIYNYKGKCARNISPR